MPKTDTDRTNWTRQWQETPFDAICVKDHPQKRGNAAATTGRLSVPALRLGEVVNDQTMYAAIHAYGGEVVVIGHGQPTPNDIYVWRGTPDEFCEMWVGD